MGQFDNPKSIAMLFAGAFLISLCVIAFLNVEVQSRSNYGTKIRSESIFGIIGKKLSQLISSLREKNSHRRALLYYLFTSQNTTRKPMRKLQYFTEDLEQEHFSEVHHRLRHEKKNRRVSEVENKEKNGSVTFSEAKLKKNTSNSNLFFDNTKYRTIREKNISEVISKEKLADHKHCYTTNEVLEIIAITCLVNFIFWFMIISCVNIFTKNQMWKNQSFESLTSISSTSEDELCPSDSVQIFDPRNADLCSIDSLNVNCKKERSRLQTEIHFSGKPNEAGRWPRKTFSIINWKRNKLLRFSNNSSTKNSVTNFVKNKNNKFNGSQSKNQKIVNSFSMENLIF